MPPVNERLQQNQKVLFWHTPSHFTFYLIKLFIYPQKNCLITLTDVRTLCWCSCTQCPWEFIVLLDHGRWMWLCCWVLVWWWQFTCTCATVQRLESLFFLSQTTHHSLTWVQFSKNTTWADVYMYTGWCNEIGSLTSPMHVTQVHPVTTENRFHCTRLYTGRRVTWMF